MPWKSNSKIGKNSHKIINSEPACNTNVVINLGQGNIWICILMHVDVIENKAVEYLLNGTEL